MTETNNILKTREALLSQNIQGLFNKEAINQNITIELKLANQELCQLNFSLDDLEKSNQQINRVVGLTIENLLNQVSTLKSVQNKLQNHHK
ncbi:hypothetical protein I2F27_11525 [Acinetobacter sp. B5B]|uniref:hypothetical protein n=1 Tax=Acinetobacter baretiae TaxID=2605383 RepID=UPI0018C1DDC7|nr:hypothetical protein [Acinetobacter baretiae]MBF7683948.1 hypothetical protein [Acinetobacter baretiae]